MQLNSIPCNDRGLRTHRALTGDVHMPLTLSMHVRTRIPVDCMKLVPASTVKELYNAVLWPSGYPGRANLCGLLLLFR